MNQEEALKKVNEYGQGHVLEYFTELTGAEQQALLQQIEQTDF